MYVFYAGTHTHTHTDISTVYMACFEKTATKGGFNNI